MPRPAKNSKGVRARPQRRKKGRQELMKVGERVGNLILIKKARLKGKRTSPAIRKCWMVKCLATIDDVECGTEFEIPEMYLRRPDNPKVDCGCQMGSDRSRFNREYRIWLMVRERTRNREHIAHKHYSDRGIDICEEWHNMEDGFEKFLAHVGPSGSMKMTLDRIDNNRGYEPDNIRWATAVQQRANQGDVVAGFTEKEINKAGYTRVEFTTLISKGANEMELMEGKK